MVDDANWRNLVLFTYAENANWRYLEIYFQCTITQSVLQLNK